MKRKTGAKTVNIRCSDFDLSEFNVNVKWINKFGCHIYLKEGWKVLTSDDIKSFHGGVTPEPSRVVSSESLSTSSKGVIISNRKRPVVSVATCALTVDDNEMPELVDYDAFADDTDDENDSIDGGSDDEMAAIDIEDVPIVESGSIDDDRDLDLIFDLGSGNPKVEPEFKGNPPAAQREHNTLNRFKDEEPGELYEKLMDELTKSVIYTSNINARRMGLQELSISEYYTLLDLWHCHGIVHTPSQFAMYNQKMGAVDTVDQIKGGHYSFETLHRCSKWNIKFFEMIFGLYQVQAWNIYRSIYGTDDRESFQLQIILHFRNHRYHNRTRAVGGRVLSGAAISSTTPVRKGVEHCLEQTPEGSSHLSNEVASKQRYREACAGGCDREIKKLTTYYCSACLKFCHPECMPNMHQSENCRVKHNQILIQIQKLHSDGHFDDIRPLKRSPK